MWQLSWIDTPPPRYILTNISPQIHAHPAGQIRCSPSPPGPASFLPGTFWPLFPFICCQCLLRTSPSTLFFCVLTSTFWTRPQMRGKFPPIGKIELRKLQPRQTVPHFLSILYTFKFKPFQDNIIPVCLPPGDISLSGRNTSFKYNSEAFYFSFPDHLRLLVHQILKQYILISLFPVSSPNHCLAGQTGLVAGWGKTDNSFGKTGTNILHKVPESITMFISTAQMSASAAGARFLIAGVSADYSKRRVHHVA